MLMDDECTAMSARPAGGLARPAVTVFVASFCIMVLELVATRLNARHLGSSIYTWTSVIGVVLAGISLGNYLGGRAADRFEPAAALSVCFALCSLSCIQIVLLDNLAGEWLWVWRLSWPVRVFTHIVLVFMLPSTLLGTISPIVTKMALERGLPAGRTVGAIYAWGAAGSIAGTLAAGFALIGVVAVTTIVWLIGGLLLLPAVFYSTRVRRVGVWAVLFLLAMTAGMAPLRLCEAIGTRLALRRPLEPGTIYSHETRYCRVFVKQISSEPDTREFIQDKLTHSKIIMSDITDLQYFYTEIYAAITHGLSVDRDKLAVMVIGGGGYVWPRYVTAKWPGSLVEVVEIDPGITRAAVKAFGLDPRAPIRTIHMDARNYIDGLLENRRLGGTGRQYDFIYGDAVNDFSAPFQLLTKEFNDRVAQLLTERGVYMLTLIDMYDCGGYLGAVVNTMERTFAHVGVYTEADLPDWARNTFVVAGSGRPLDMPTLIKHYPKPLEIRSLNEQGMAYIRAQSRGIMFTDDYAPVENLLAPVVRESARGFLAFKYMNEAAKYQSLGQTQRSIDYYRKAAGTKPALTTEVYSRIGRIYAEQSRYAEAIEAYETALEHNRNSKRPVDIREIEDALEDARSKLLGRREPNE